MWKLISSCLLLYSVVVVSNVGPASARQEWPDIFSAQVTGNSVTISHANALYNCCIDGVEYAEISHAPGQIEIEEVWLLEYPCDCQCYFRLSFDITDLAAGQWTVLINYLDHFTYEWAQGSVSFMIEQAGSGEPELSGFENSDCLELTAIDADYTYWDSTWSGLKTWYRGD